jgi:hypothetical protein
MVDRAEIIRKIQALRARAADAASTEAEAAMAARKAQELLDKHNLTLDEAEVRADGVGSQTWDNGGDRAPAVVFALPFICDALNVEHFFTGGRISIVGAPADVEVALYYIDLVENAAWRCWKAFMATPHYRYVRVNGRASPRKIGIDYRKGVAVRVGDRIRKQASADKASPESSGNALVLVKNQLIDEWMAKNGIKTKARGMGTLSDSFSIGLRDGAAVPISRGVGSSHVARPALSDNSEANHG